MGASDSSIIEARCQRLYDDIAARKEAVRQPRLPEAEQFAKYREIDEAEICGRAEIEQSAEFKRYLFAQTEHASREQLLRLLIELARDYQHAGPGSTLDSDEAVHYIARRLNDR